MYVKHVGCSTPVWNVSNPDTYWIFFHNLWNRQTNVIFLLVITMFIFCKWGIWTWWRHQMETFWSSLVICAGNSPVTGEFPAQRPVTRALVFPLFGAWINGWVNNCEPVDLRPHRAHYDVTVMKKIIFIVTPKTEVNCNWSMDIESRFLISHSDVYHSRNFL